MAGRAERVNCPNCQAQLAEASRTCAYCGTQLPTTSERPDAAATRLTPTAAPAATMTRIVPAETGVYLPLTDTITPAALPAVPLATPLARRSSRSLRDPFVVAIVVLALVVLGTGGYAFSTAQTLEQTRGALNATQASLDATSTNLTATKADLDTTRTSLSSVRSSLVAAQAQITQLQGRVKGQDQCIQALNDNIRELGTVDALMTANYNRTAVGSRWANANAAKQTAIASALDAYYQAYSQAFAGQKAQANSSVASGNSYVQTAADQTSIMNAEIANNNQALANIEAAFAAFNTHLAQTKTTCGL